MSVVALIVIVLGAGGWWLYQQGMRDGGYEGRAARATEAHLRVKVAELRERINVLARRNTLLERTQRIDEQALARLRDTIAGRDDQIARNEEELSFYRNLVSPSDTQPSLHVRRLNVAPVPGAPRTYRYELVLTQLNGDDTVASGQVNLVIKARRRDGPVTLKLDEVAADGIGPETAFRFKYFQTLRGRVRLPAANRPLGVDLRVEPDGDRLKPIEKSYAWKALLTGGN